MARHNQLGSWGEDIAAAMLVSQGYAIVERNWRSGHNELDIVAMKGGRLVFVEVKTRSKGDIDPVTAIDRKKISRLVSAAMAYSAMKKLEHEMQFDIIMVVGSPDDYEVEHLPDAFMPPLKTY